METKYYIVKLENRSDGAVNATIENRSTLSLALSLYYKYASSAVASDSLLSVRIMLIDNEGDTKKDEMFETAYVPTTEETAEAEAEA